MDWKAILLLAATFLAVFFGIVFIFRQVYHERLAVSQQIEKMKKQSKDIYKIKLKTAEKKAPKLPFMINLERKLTSAGIALTGQEAMLLYVMVVIFPPLCIIALTRNVLISLLAMAVLALLPVLFVRSKIKKQQKEFDAQLGDILRIVANSMRMGFSFLQSMGNLAKEVADPAGRELMKVVKDIDLGMTQEAALLSLEERMNSKELHLVNSALNIQRQTGGNLADLLENLSETILNRQKVYREIRVVTSQGRISSKVIGLMPVALFLAMMAINASYLLDFMKEPIGLAVVILGFVMDAVGFLVIHNMVNIKY